MASSEDGPMSKKPRLDGDILSTLNDDLPDDLLSMGNLSSDNTPNSGISSGGPTPASSQQQQVPNSMPNVSSSAGPMRPMMQNGTMANDMNNVVNSSVTSSQMGPQMQMHQMRQQRPTGPRGPRPQQQQQVVSMPNNQNINLVNALKSGPQGKIIPQQSHNGPMMPMNVGASGMSSMNNGNVIQQGPTMQMSTMQMAGKQPQQQQQMMMGTRAPIMLPQYQQRPNMNMAGPSNPRMPNVRMQGPGQVMVSAGQPQFVGANPVINSSVGQRLQQPQQQQQAGNVPMNQMPPRYPANKIESGNGPAVCQSNQMPNLNQQQGQMQAGQSVQNNPISGAPNSANGPSAPTSADPEKRKLIQQQLVLLLHAHKCQRRDKEIAQNGGQVVQCNLPHCRTMKNVLNHMTSCQAGKSCTVAHCSSSRQIIAHWKHCNRPDCPVCLPLKQADNGQRRPGAPGQPQQQQQPGQPQQQSQGNMGPGSVGQASSTPGSSQVTNATATTTNGPQPQSLPVLLSPQNQQQQQQQQNQQQSNQHPGPTTSPGLPDESMKRALAALGLPPSGQFTATSGTQARAPGPNVRPMTSNQQQQQGFMGQSNTNTTHNSPSQLARELMNEGQQDPVRLPNNLPVVSAAPIAANKEWHSSVTADLRNHLVHKLVQAIFPTPDPSAILDRRMNNLVNYARRVEGEMYAMANSRSEYYHLLAEKIYKIQKELEEKRAKRRNMQAQQQGCTVSQANVPVVSTMQQQVRPGVPVSINAQQGQPNMMANYRPGVRPQTSMSNARMPMAPNSNQNGPTSMFQTTSQMGSLDPNVSSSVSTSNPMLRNHLEQGNMSQQQSKLVHQLQQPNKPTTSVMSSIANSTSSGSSMLLSQLAKQPTSDPNPNIINEVAGGLASKVPNETLPGLLSQQRSLNQQQHMNSLNSDSMDTKQMDIKQEADVKQEMDIKPDISDVKPDIKQEQMDTSSNDMKPGTSIAKQEIIKQEIKKEPMDSKDSMKKPGEKGKNKVSFTPEELRRALEPPLMKLYNQDPEAIPFRNPVDPIALQIPDYFDVIKTPMDMSTIKEKLETGQYSEPWEFVDDVWLMFDNAWLYNRRSSKVYKACSKLAEIFEADIEPIMKSLGYCCGRKHTYSPQTLCCYGQQNTICTINRGATYFVYENKNPTPALFSDKYCFCTKCFNDIKGDNVPLCDDPSQPQTFIPKTEFIEKKNDVLEYEKFVTCDDCGRKLHQVCVLHSDQIWPGGFTCDNCHKKRGTKRKENRYTAKRLPTTRLGAYIETRVNNFLRKKEADSGEVYIRVVYSGDKTVEVKQGMKKRFVDTGEMRETFPYRARAMFAFEEIDGVDVCFFGMHVQEYGSESPAPNTRRVYIAYLDSVHFFKPRHFRTSVYHEILLGYLDYMKKLGYTLAHIWACPPSEGDDYIFHCHPPDQRMPKPKRLQEWYKKMLDKGIIERIVLDYKDIYKQALEDNLQSAAELPYFEGDFWPNVLEENIRELEQEEEARKREMEEQERLAAAEAAAADVNEGEDTNPEASNTQDGKKGGKKKNQKKKKSSAQRKNTKKNNSSGSAGDLTSKLFSTMEKHKEVFFTIRLHSAQSAASLNPIVDPDPIMACDLMDGRDAFLTMARDRHLEFSSLRRCKFSTMILLYELHTQNQDKFVYTCNTCVKSVETRYHCTVCEDFDLCVECYQKDGHPHKMEKLGFGLDNEGGESNASSGRQQSVQRCIQSLVHSCQCRDANCRLPSCQKMKRVVQHSKSCKRKTNGGCTVCKQLIALCCYHARMCSDAKCPVLFCSNIKTRLRQQQLQQRLQEAAMMRRRIARMNQSLGVSTAASTDSGGKPQAHPHKEAIVSSSMPHQNIITSAINSKPVSSHGKPGVTMSNNSQPTPGVLEAVKKVQEEANRQSRAHPGTGKGNPQVMGQMNQGGMQQSGMMGQNQWSQQQQQQQQQQRFPMQNQRPQMGPGQQGGAGGPGGQIGITVGGAGGGQQRPTMQSLQQLIHALKSPSSPQQQQQVLSILKSNPSLMAAFIKQRTQQQNQGQCGQQGGGVMGQGQGGGNAMPGQGMPQGMAQNMAQGNMGQQQQQQQMSQPMNQQQMMQQQRFRAIHLQQQQQQQQQQGNFNSPGNFQAPAPPYSRPMGMNQGQFPPGMMQQGMMGSQAQQMLSQVRSPPPGMAVRSPQPGASPRTGPGQMINSPRNQPIPSPRHPMGGGNPNDDMGSSQMMLGQPGGNNPNNGGMNMNAPNMMQNNPDQDNGPQSTISPQDQLSKFVETL